MSRDGGGEGAIDDPSTINKSSLMKLTASLSLLSAIALTAPGSGAIVSTFSVDFHGDFQPDTLSPTDVAGVIPTTNWIPAYGATGGTSGLTNTGIGGTIFVGWNGPITGTIGGSASSNPDEDMMEGYIGGYLDAAGSVQVATVQVATLNLAALGWDFYDLYVYSDQGMTPPNVGLITRVGAPDPVTTLNHLEHPLGYGAGAPGYLDSGVFPDGNHVKYSGLTAPVFSLVAGPDSGSGSTAINGFEIVGHKNIPEPSTSLVVILGAGLLAIRRKRV